jgi:putative phage-type endonuclease
MKINNCEQGSQEWIDARLCKISGTRLGDAIGTPAKQESLINELIAESLTGMPKENYVNLAMAKGMEAEEFAIEEYELRTGEMTEQVGLCTNDEFDWLINSPDRLIKEDGKYTKAVEVKCPNTDTMIGYIRKGGIPKDYLPQVMSYFLVNKDLEELDFVVYDPRIETEQYRLVITNVRRKDLPLKEAKEDLLKFYEKYQEELKKLNLEL